LYADLSSPGRYVEHVVYESWVDHLRHFERMTAADTLLRERRYAMNVDAEPPQVSRWVASGGDDQPVAARTTLTVQTASAATCADTLPRWRRSLPLLRAPITM
jgi:hypothetical protein